MKKVKEMNEKMMEQIQNVTHVVQELQNATHYNMVGVMPEKGRLHFLEKTNQISNDHYSQIFEQQQQPFVPAGQPLQAAGFI